jgi:hypothetical protein
VNNAGFQAVSASTDDNPSCDNLAHHQYSKGLSADLEILPAQKLAKPSTETVVVHESTEFDPRCRGGHGFHRGKAEFCEGGVEMAARATVGRENAMSQRYILH